MADFPPLKIFYLINRKDWPELQQFIKDHPDAAACEQDNSSSLTGQGGNLPFHELCKNNPPFSILKQIYQANPSAISTKGEHGCLPLHHAVSNGASADIVEFLLTENVEGAYDADDTRSLPLHLACKWSACPVSIRVLLAINPEALGTKDGHGYSPLEYARKIPVAKDRSLTLKSLELAPLLLMSSAVTRQRATDQSKEEHRNELKNIRNELKAKVQHQLNEATEKMQKAESERTGCQYQLKTLALKYEKSKKFEEEQRVQLAKVQQELEEERKKSASTMRETLSKNDGLESQVQRLRSEHEEAIQQMNEKHCAELDRIQTRAEKEREMSAERAHAAEESNSRLDSRLKEMTTKYEVSKQIEEKQGHQLDHLHEKLQDERADWSRKIREAGAEKTELESQITSLAADYENMVKAAEDKNRLEMEQLTQKLKEAELINAELEAKLEEEVAKSEKWQQIDEEQRFDIEELRHQLQNEQLTNDQLKEVSEKNYDENRLEVEQLAQKLKEAESIKAGLEAKVEELVAESEKWQQVDEEQRLDIKELQHQLQAEQLANDQLKEVSEKYYEQSLLTCKAQLSQIEKAMMERNKLAKTLEFHQVEITDYEEQVENLLRQNDDLIDEVEQLKQATSTIIGNNAEAIKQYEVDKANKSTLIENLSSNVKSLEKKKSSLDSQISSLQEDIDGFEEQVANITHFNENLTKELNELKASSTSELGRRDDSIIDLEKQVESMTAKHEALTSTKESLQKTKAELLDQVASLESELAAFRENLKNAFEEREQLRKEKMDLQVQFNAAEEETRTQKAHVGQVRDMVKAFVVQDIDTWKPKETKSQLIHRNKMPAAHPLKSVEKTRTLSNSTEDESEPEGEVELTAAELEAEEKEIAEMISSNFISVSRKDSDVSLLAVGS